MPQSDLDRAADEALRLIGPDPQNWVPDREGVDYNVVIVGAGQSGVAFAFALRRAGIGRVSIIDAARDETSAGVWLTSARMHKLRTPKNLVGPELGLPGLSFQAWYEARNGQAAYDALDQLVEFSVAGFDATFQVGNAFPLFLLKARSDAVIARKIEIDDFDLAGCAAVAIRRTLNQTARQPSGLS